MRADDQRQQLRRKIILVAILFAFIALIYLIYNVSRFDRLTNINAMDYAQIARHVVRGDGFITSFIKPLSLSYDPSITNHPDIIYPPVHMVWTAGVMRMLGENDRAVSHSSGLAFLLTVPLVFLLALKLFDWRTAVLATFLFGTHIANLGYAISGLESSLLGLFFMGLLLLLYQASESDSHEMTWVAAAGLVMGLLFMTKYVWVMVAIPVILFLIFIKPQRRAARVGVFLLLLIAISTPWLYRNYNLTGNPLFTLRVHEVVGQTRAYPANIMYRTVPDTPPSSLVFVGENPRAIFEKVRGGLSTFYTTFQNLGGVFVTPFFIVGILVRLGNDRVEKLRYVLYGTIILVSITLAFIIAAPRLIAPVSGFVTVLAAALFWRLLEARGQSMDLRVRTRFVVAAVAVLAVLHVHPFATAITPDEPDYTIGETPLETAMTQLREMTDGPVLTDIPWTVAWMADMNAVWLPQTHEDFRRLEDRVGRFEWLLLTPTVAQMAGPERLEAWANVWVRAQQADAEYLGFAIAARLGDGRWILMRRQPDD